MKMRKKNNKQQVTVPTTSTSSSQNVNRNNNNLNQQLTSTSTIISPITNRSRGKESKVKIVSSTPRSSKKKSSIITNKLSKLFSVSTSGSRSNTNSTSNASSRNNNNNHVYNFDDDDIDDDIIADRTELLSPRYNTSDKEEDDDSNFHTNRGRYYRYNTNKRQDDNGVVWEGPNRSPVTSMNSNSKIGGNIISDEEFDNGNGVNSPSRNNSKILKSRGANFVAQINPSQRQYHNTNANFINEFEQQRQSDQHRNNLKELSNQHLHQSNQHLQDEIHKLAHVSLGDDLTVSTFSLRQQPPLHKDDSKSFSSSYDKSYQTTPTHILAALERNGRPPSAKRCHVDISPGELDGEVWKYRICIRDDHPLSVLGGGWSHQPTSIIANVERSLQDFAWLEKSLQEEFSGGLVLPCLTLALNPPTSKVTPTIPKNTLEKAMDENLSVNEKLLIDWLSDVLNSIRGRGEILFLKCPDVLPSESMETFLYRNIDNLPKKNAEKNVVIPRSSSSASYDNSLTSTRSRSSRLENTNLCSFTSFFDDNNWKQEEGEEGAQSAFGAMFWRPLSCFVSTPSQQQEFLNENKKHNRNTKRSNSIPLEMVSCASRSNINEVASPSSADWSATSSQQSRNKNAFTAIQSKQIEFQSQVFSSYQKYTKQALSKLHTYLEEEMHIQSTWKRFAISLSNLFNFEKDIEMCRIIGTTSQKKGIRKSKLDDGLRVLAKHKYDRSYTPMTLLASLLHSYLSDLYSIETSLKVYNHAVSNVSSRRHADVRNDTSEKRLLQNEQLLQSSLHSFYSSTSIRMSRMSWKLYSCELNQIQDLNHSASSLRNQLDANNSNDASSWNTEIDCGPIELDLVYKIIHIQGDVTHPPEKEDALFSLVEDRLGRWNADVALEIMSLAGVSDADISVDETTRDLRLVRKYAIGLRDCLDRCREAISALQGLLLEEEVRTDLYEVLCHVFSGTYHSNIPTPMNVIPPADRSGWLPTNHESTKCGNMLTNSYQSTRTHQSLHVLQTILSHLQQYETRIEGIESYVYMHCVGIQLEKHYSTKRKEALAAWEKKTDITTAINIAQRKRLPVLVHELKSRMELTPNVSHTTVKQAKERHLSSKLFKADLQELALKRFQRLKDTSTDCIIQIIQFWTAYEETTCKEDISKVKSILTDIKDNVTEEDLECDGGAHLFSSSIVQSNHNENSIR